MPPTTTPPPSLLPSTGGNSGISRLPVPPRPTASSAWSQLLHEGPARDQLVAVEAELSRGDHAEAVRMAARAFAESAKADSSSSEIAPVLHALVLGIGGRRYLRFCEAAERAERGAATAEDALFAAFFLADAALDH